MDKPRILGVMQGQAFQARKGSAFYHIFEQFQEQNLLANVVDINLSPFFRKLFLVRNFSFDRKRWNAKDQLDMYRYHAMSSQAHNKLNSHPDNFNSIVQIGSTFNLSSFFRDKGVPCFSFHDNNVFGYTRSLPEYTVSKGRIDSAISYEKRVYEDLSGIFTMSKTLARSFVEDFSLPEEKVHYAGFGSPFPAEDVSRKDYAGKTILMVATHSFERKGGETVLKAFKELKRQMKDAQLVLVGRDWGIEVEGVSNVGFLDKRNPDDLERYKGLFREASLFVMPSYNEAFGEVFVEAMSYGVPCIGSKTGVMPEILVDNDCGTVITPGDSQELSKLMYAYLNDPSYLRKLGENAVDAVRNEYSWRNVISRMTEVIGRHTK